MTNISLPTKSELYGNNKLQSVLPTKSELYGNKNIQSVISTKSGFYNNNNQSDFIKLNIYENNQINIDNLNMNEIGINLSTNYNIYNEKKYGNFNNDIMYNDNKRENPYAYSDNIRNNQNYIRFQNQQKPNENNYLVNNNINNNEILDNNRYNQNQFIKNKQNLENNNKKEAKLKEKEVSCFLRFCICLCYIFCLPCLCLCFIFEDDCQGGTERYCEQCRRICCCEKLVLRDIPGQK